MTFRENICNLLDKQIAKGKSKYGYALEDNYQPLLDRLTHLEEEMVDALMYCQWVRQWINQTSGLCIDDICKGAANLNTRNNPLAKAICALAKAQEAIDNKRHSEAMDELAEAILYIAETAGRHAYGGIGKRVHTMLINKKMQGGG